MEALRIIFLPQWFLVFFWSSVLSTLLFGICGNCWQGMKFEKSSDFHSCRQGKSRIPEGTFRKPQALNGLSEDYCGISSELRRQRNTSVLLLSVMASKMGMWAFTGLIFVSLFFWCMGGEWRRSGGQCSFFPSGMQSWGLLPASRALKVKCKNGRSQGPKKNDILLVTTPPAGAFVVGASAFNWKQVQAPPMFLPHPSLTHTRAETTFNTLTSVRRPLKLGDSLLNLKPGANPYSLQDLCPHLSVRTSGVQVRASNCYMAGGKQGRCAGIISDSAQNEWSLKRKSFTHKSINTFLFLFSSSSWVLTTWDQSEPAVDIQNWYSWSDIEKSVTGDAKMGKWKQLFCIISIRFRCNNRLTVLFARHNSWQLPVKKGNKVWK